MKGVSGEKKQLYRLNVSAFLWMTFFVKSSFVSKFFNKGNVYSDINLETLSVIPMLVSKQNFDFSPA